ncbi:hypothetical protein [Mycobacterium vicinigordonae]|uniref:Alpha/beta hydrolase n=1 Tax=Mycobacterium vicinigordonae TaxID=1719132 RepID=A0A7D6HYR9_9MYCO|nr:hypothetical protein [Mycobacterium vicinigordonae]QLL08075.1 hypothetical protein H0P51_03580 [Mycobacterium vicinigordonae]
MPESAQDTQSCVLETGDAFFPLKWARRLRDLIPGITEVVTLDGARMHFPDYRAGELLAPLLTHWARHPD